MGRIGDGGDKTTTSVLGPSAGKTAVGAGQVVNQDGKIENVVGGVGTVFTSQEQASKDLVTVQKPPGLCRAEVKRFRMPGDKMKLPPGYDVYGPPKKKANNYMKETERYDQIAYFFDYVDDVFQKDIVTAFKALLEEAKTIPPEPSDKFNDPYTVDKLLWYWSHGLAGKDPQDGHSNVNLPPIRKEEAAADPIILVQYNRDFDPEVFKNSFGAPQISAIIKAFGWTMTPNDPMYFKKLIDKFDFDGNGRLDPREFLFMAIWENYKNFYSCRKHCFKEIMDSKVNPLFTFFDCDNDGYINSENLWEGCKYLKRKDEAMYNMYKCEVPKQFNKYYRTHAPNDFVLKNLQVADGYLNREEFRKGILLGYWERQLNGMYVVEDDSLNKKSTRWDEKGIFDKDCNELIQMYDKDGQ